MPEYIERNKVLSGEEFFGEHLTQDNPMADGCMAVRSEFIMNLPAADVAPVRHGQWINFEWKSLTTFSCKCNQCGITITTSLNYNFCPICGVIMDGDGRCTTS